MKPWQTLALVVLAAVAGVVWERWQSPIYAVAAVRDTRTGEVALFRMHVRTGRLEIKSLTDRTASPWIPVAEDGFEFTSAQVKPDR
jgi:hypothetical protein